MKASPTQEVNFDGLVGPTHNYAGLSHGNVASASHRGARSHPRAAALQGLEKMRMLAALGLPQAVLPPHERPNVAALRALGFTGRDDAAILRSAQRTTPELLAACSSASAMWVANAATVTPSRDAPDGRVHLTPANLVAKFHRSIEPPQTTRTLRAIFRDDRFFAIHAPLPACPALGDEGAANHTRLAPAHGRRGLHFFVYGHTSLPSRLALGGPRRYPSRQSLEASQAVCRRHRLAENAVVFARQNPAAIDAGVFHNDVIAVGNENFFLYHEDAFVDTPRVIRELRRRYASLHRGAELSACCVPRARVSLKDAVQSYLFNAQVVTVSPGRMVLIAPTACEENVRVKAWLDDAIARGKTPLREVRTLDLRQSMGNGGGPACLRLRVVLTAAERSALPPRIFLTDTVHTALVAWVNRHYRETLAAAELADPHLLEESRAALDALTRLLGLGSIYSFQTAGADA